MSNLTTLSQMPSIGAQIIVNNVSYIILHAQRLGFNPHKSWHDNIKITAKRPHGRRRYCIYQYASGAYSRAL